MSEVKGVKDNKCFEKIEPVVIAETDNFYSSPSGYTCNFEYPEGFDMSNSMIVGFRIFQHINATPQYVSPGSAYFTYNSGGVSVGFSGSASATRLRAELALVKINSDE